jgi:hypothetical protein
MRACRARWVCTYLVNLGREGHDDAMNFHLPS